MISALFFFLFPASAFPSMHWHSETHALLSILVFLGGVMDCSPGISYCSYIIAALNGLFHDKLAG